MPIQINETYTQLFNAIQDPEIRYIIVYGGRRSGKSYAVSDIVTYIAATTKTFIPVIRKYGTSLKDSVFQRINNSLLDNEIPHNRNKTDKEFTLKNASRIRCFGLDDPEKLKSLEDAEIVWFEEATENLEKDVDTIDAGLSPKNGNAKIILTHNPVPVIPGLEHWIQRRFLRHPHEMSKLTKVGNVAILKTWYKDNAFCPEATIRLLEGYKETNMQLYKMWALGEFTTLEGVVFENWDVVKEVPENVELSGYGLDFGYSVDPAAVIAVYVAGKDIYLKGLIYAHGLTNDDLYQRMIDAGVTTNSLVVADSAEPKSIESIFRKGLRGIRGVKKRTNYKEDMVNELRGYNIHIVEGDINLQREISTFSWARDKQDNQLPKLQDGDDHYMDAFIMFMHNMRHTNAMKIPTMSIY